MKPVVKALIAALGCALAVFVTFSIPQALFILVKRASEKEPGGPDIPLAPIFFLSSIPAVVGGIIAFAAFWYYFHLQRRERRALRKE